jgi:hypothetical protein
MLGGGNTTMNKEELSKYNKKWRDSNRDKIRAIDKRYYESHREELIKKITSYKKKYPEKHRARGLIGMKILRGTLKREPCVLCGKEKAQAHHPNYSFPTYIVFLCTSHHKLVHLGKVKLKSVK